MKLLPYLLAAAAVILAPLPAPAQDAAPAHQGVAIPPAPDANPAPATSNAGASEKDAAATVPLSGQSTGPELDKPGQLMPEAIPSNPKPHGHSGGKRGEPPLAPQPGPALASTFKAEQDLKTLIRLRQIQTRAQNDPSIQADWDAAHRAKSDPKRRELLTIYYNHLYGRMLKLDSSLAEKIQARRAAALGRLQYNRLREATGEQAANGNGSETPPPGASYFPQ